MKDFPVRLLKLLIIVAALALTPLAFADTTETFTFYGIAPQNYNGYNGLFVEGSFTATSGYQNLANVWEITSVSGSVTYPNNGGSSVISGLVADPTYTPITSPSGFIYDNLFYTAISPVPDFNPPYPYPDGFDYYGLLLSTVDGNNVNLFTNYISPAIGTVPVYADNFYSYTNYAYFEVSDPTGLGGTSGSGFVVVGATPEPSSLMLLGTGVLGLAAAVRRRIAVKIK